MAKYFTICCLLLTSLAQAANGDTTWVNVHSKTQMTWYQRYSEKALLPDGSKSYHKILMYYTLGCATGGCSDWDYTTRLTLLHPTGAIDSTVSRIDTLSQNPLVTDTIWDVFAVKEPFELARVITPYGNGLPNDWTHDFVYDVTDYYPLLKDSVEIEVFYQGWSAGFSADVNFAFIEGPRPREVYSIQNVYMGQGDYLTSANFEQNHLPAKTVQVHSDATGMYLRANFSGHGFVNTLNCAEFCNKDYYVKVNGQTVATQAMWRDDCGLNPIWPQGGTWLYDRANWCPGDKSLFREHTLDAFVGNATVAIDLDIEPYSYTVPPGEVPAGYNYAVQLIQHGPATFANDVELERILAPSSEDEFGRINPICGTAVVKIRNKGSLPLTSCTFRYGLKGQAWSSFSWTGNLAPMESAVVELPFGPAQDWWAVAGSNFTFEAFAENPNGVPDENPVNNSYHTTFEAPETLPGKMKFSLRTNARGSDTHWSLTALDGTVIDAGDNLSSNTLYTYSFDLSEGCYILSVKDRSKNGLSFFGNNDGNGSLQLKNDGGSFFFKNLNANFGTELSQYFTVGYSIGINERINEAFFFDVYPNPAHGTLHVQLNSKGKKPLTLTLLNAVGKTVLSINGEMEDELLQKLDISTLAAGLYTVEVQLGGEVMRKKVVLQ